MKIKQRLDARLQDDYPQFSRTQLQSWIMQGKVTIDGIICTKSGTLVVPDAVVVLTAQEPKYVCRAGYKLEGALEYFGIDVTDKTILDAGLSTGGFTDCLLQRGARKVYGIDVGYGQVHEKIRGQAKVIVLERTNLRAVRDVGELVDLVTLDLSFISVLKVMDAVCAVLKPQGRLVVLIKPQFEAEREDVERGGLITDPAVHERVTKKVIEGIEQYGFYCEGMIESPLLGTTGNKEFLASFVRK